MESKYVPKVGDRVIITKSNINWAEPEMDAYVGRLFTISGVEFYEAVHKVRFEDMSHDMSNWDWIYEHGHFRRFNLDDRKSLKINFKI